MGLRWRFPLTVTLCVAAFMILADSVFVPLHEQTGGKWTGMLNGMARMLELPGLMFAETFGARFRHHTGLIAWVVMIGFSLPFYYLVAIFLRRAWGSFERQRIAPSANPLTPVSERTREDPDPSSDQSESSHVSSESNSDPTSRPATNPEAALVSTSHSDPTPLISRRGLFISTRRIALAGMAGTAGYAFLGELNDVHMTRQRIGIRNLPQPLSGLRVVQLTDIHHGPWTSLEYIRRVVDQTNALNPDLVVLTGDYVHQSEVYIEPVVKELSRLRGKVGVLATLGNHDWWESRNATALAFARTSIRLIDNDRVYLTAERELAPWAGSRDAALCIAGVGDLWEGSPDYERALAGLPASMPRILLSHNPDVAEERPLLRMGKSIDRIDLMLSGHTHGGQISLPGVGTLVTPSKYGNRYAVGLVQGPLGPVYINRGIGTTIIPMRLRVPPEIAVIELQRA